MAVQHETRYVFWLRTTDEHEEARGAGEIPASEILDELGALIEKLDLLKSLPAGSRLWRPQTHDVARLDPTAKRMGTAPLDLHKQANRMSPAGIPMFYGSSDPATASAEATLRTKDPWVTTAAFDTTCDSAIVDFSSLPFVPSIFDAVRAGSRQPLLFLHDFVRTLSEPCRDEFGQIDYVPTQIVTECLLRIFLRGDVVRGLRYPSAVTGGVNVVLDVSNGDCVNPSDDLDDE